MGIDAQGPNVCRKRRDPAQCASRDFTVAPAHTQQVLGDGRAPPLGMLLHSEPPPPGNPSLLPAGRVGPTLRKSDAAPLRQPPRIPSSRPIEPVTPAHPPWRWIPTLYFAEGLPYVVVMTLSVVMYKNLGVGNTEIALYTSWLYLPWVIKPLCSPWVELLGTRRRWIIAAMA